jgi:AraC-like DNA-binding protein
LRKIHSGEIFILFPDVWHRFTPSKKTGWDEIWVEFNGDLINQFLSNEFITSKDPVKKIGLHNDILANLNQIIHLIDEEKPGWQFIASGLLTGILGMIVVGIKYQPFSGSEIEQKIRLAKKILQDNLHTPLNQEEVAILTGMSYTSYRKSFKSITGISPKQYLINLRIDKAKELLIMDNLSIREITDSLNIDSVYYFTQQFRQRTGFMPIEYQNKNRRGCLKSSVTI